MIATETQSSAPSATANHYYLRVLGQDGSSERIPLAWGRSAIGSSPRCTVSLAAPGVEPLHCLIINDQHGLTARAWSASSVNGSPINEAELRNGDILSVGDATLEIVVEPRSGELHSDEPASEPVASGEETGWAESTAEGTGNSEARPAEPEGERPFEIRAEGVDSDPHDGVDKDGVDKCVSAEAAGELFHQLQSANEIARGRSRKLLSSLRSQREEFRGLDARLAELEKVLQEVSVERESTRQMLEGTIRRLDEWTERQGEHSSDQSGAAPGAEDWANLLAINARQSDEIEKLADTQRRAVEQMVAVSQRVAELERQFSAIPRALADQDDRSARAPHLENEGYGEREFPSYDEPADQPAAEEQHADEASHELGAEEGSHPAPEEWNRGTEVDPLAEAHKTIPLGRRGRSLRELLEAEEREASQENAEAEHSNGEMGFGGEISESQAPLVDSEGSESALTYESPEMHGNPEADVTQESAPTDSHAESIESPLEGDAVESSSSDAEQSGAERANGAATSSEEAIDHLRELSIWKEGTSEEDREQDPAPAQSSSERDPEKPSRESTSFVERFSHLFEQDEPTPGGQFQARGQERTGYQETRPSDALHASSMGERSGRGEDEESLEAYMVKLLARVRGTSTPDGAAAQPNGAAPGNHASLVAERSPHPGGEEDPAPQRLTSLAEIKRGEPAPERAADLQALRQVANESARRAIGTHASRKHRHRALTKVAVALMAGMVSLALMIHSPGWSNPQFIVACISLMVAAYWAGQSYGAVVESIRAGSFDDPATDGARKLPIDVEKKAPADAERTESAE